MSHLISPDTQKRIKKECVVVVVDSGNERFFQFAFVPTSVTEREKSDETFSRTFLAHILSVSSSPLISQQTLTFILLRPLSIVNTDVFVRL